MLPVATGCPRATYSGSASTLVACIATGPPEKGDSASHGTRLEDAERQRAGGAARDHEPLAGGHGDGPRAGIRRPVVRVSAGTASRRPTPKGRCRGRRYARAVAASLVAETVFVAATMAMAQLRGKDPWHVTRASASLVFGPAVASPPGFVRGDVARGLAAHVMYSVVAGGIYGALLPRLRLTPVQGGLVAGGVLYLLGSYLLPDVLGEWVAPMRKSPEEKAMAAVMHAVYGVVFGLTYGVLTERRER